MSVYTTIGKSQSINGLSFITYINATTTGNTFINIPYNRQGAFIHRFFLQNIGKSIRIYSKIICQSLKFALIICNTSWATNIVVRKNHFNKCFTISTQFFGVCNQFHTFRNGSTTSSFWSGISHDFYHANSTISSGR